MVTDLSQNNLHVCRVMPIKLGFSSEFNAGHAVQAYDILHLFQLSTVYYRINLYNGIH